MYPWQFQKKKKKFLPKNGGHFEFSNICQKWKNTNLLVSLTVRERAVSMKLLTHKVSRQTTFCNFWKNFLSPKKLRPFWIFQFLPKMVKHKFASVSLTVWDRAISSKFSTRGYLRNVLLAILKKFSSPKMAAILNFQIFAKNRKNKLASVSLTMRDRVILSKVSTHRVF